MKVSELQGAYLNYWVAKAEGLTVVMHNGHSQQLIELMHEGLPQHVLAPHYGLWGTAGPIIEREQISITCTLNCPPVWRATIRGLKGNHSGETALIAAMRAFVASKFGEEVADV